MINDILNLSLSTLYGLIWLFYLRKEHTSLSTSSQYCWCPMDLTKSQVATFWNLWKAKSWHVLLRPTLRWVPLQVRAFYWRCRDSGIYRVLQKRSSNLTLAEVAENLRQPQGGQEEEEGSRKGNCATSNNTSWLFWKNTSLLFCKNTSWILCKNTSWLFRPRRCLTRPLGTTQPLLWWSNSWQWEGGDPIRWVKTLGGIEEVEYK